MLWLAGDVKEPICLSNRVGHEVPGVVVWLWYTEGWGGKIMLRDISHDKATVLYNLSQGK